MLASLKKNTQKLFIIQETPLRFQFYKINIKPLLTKIFSWYTFLRLLPSLVSYNMKIFINHFSVFINSLWLFERQLNMPTVQYCKTALLVVLQCTRRYPTLKIHIFVHPMQYCSKINCFFLSVETVCGTALRTREVKMTC